MEPICWNGAARNGRASHFLNSYSSMRDIMCAKISLIYEADFIALRSQLTLPTKPTSSDDEVNSIFEGKVQRYRECDCQHCLTGWKSRASPNSGNCIVKGKGVHREVESRFPPTRLYPNLSDSNKILVILKFNKKILAVHCFTLFLINLLLYLINWELW